MTKKLLCIGISVMVLLVLTACFTPAEQEVYNALSEEDKIVSYRGRERSNYLISSNVFVSDGVEIIYPTILGLEDEVVEDE